MSELTMRGTSRIGSMGLASAIVLALVPACWGQFPVGMGFRGPGFGGMGGYGGMGLNGGMGGYGGMGFNGRMGNNTGTGNNGGMGYNGGYAPFVGVYAPLQGGYGYGYGGYDPTVNSATSGAYFTYGNTSYTTESPSPIPVYGGPRTPYGPTPPSTPLSALLKVQVPADAEVWLEGRKMSSVGAHRLYRSPPLNPAKGYVYEVRARWNFDGKSVEDVRQVSIRAGATALVDFTHLDPLVPRPSIPVEMPKTPAKSDEPPASNDAAKTPSK
jgi:uncharacterized protein (TIGR03000 family)